MHLSWRQRRRLSGWLVASGEAQSAAGGGWRHLAGGVLINAASGGVAAVNGGISV